MKCNYFVNSSQNKTIEGSSQGFANGRRGGVRPPIFLNLQESWLKVSHAARGLVTLLSAILCLK